VRRSGETRLAADQGERIELLKNPVSSKEDSKESFKKKSAFLYAVRNVKLTTGPGGYSA